ncbi:archaetidylserine decarboxylase [Anaeromyxobacter paludicola]|uniref:phosphatidylserine decarboxylase n=1 Tax=Anaeromyxobacter paludicola TaxID=2918171 RepID=A0ABN6N7L3_9BACT|nr:archaetidylserine decarboxylase [Anaeromyxobacter paludicola]BDG07843.1 phosphatidylserine decarboxylase proenzyme [Anaeromyxobacter paludicola]
MNDRAFVAALRLLPKNTLSRLVGAATRLRAPRPVREAAMRAFATRYGLDLTECAGLECYETFGEFFARPLKPGLRPIAAGETVLVSPVDGTVSESGRAEAGRMVQAKGIDYRLGDLLGDAALGERFEGGAYVTLYLSPRDYHRIHFPLGGAVSGYRYVPGRLWPVNPASVRTVPGLFTVNERLVTVLETPLGGCAVVAVGATVVGRVRAYYDPAVPVSNLRGARPISRDYAPPLPAVKGAELGAFEMGSTVILVLEQGRAALSPQLVAGVKVRVGQPIGGPPAP